ncbi:beta-phosphoglucomutase family hydrolase [Nocardia aurea]|uniref:Beta-phosphoglucomutase n=1 Tax=Nocardia aurea TaxID=2144174 RepID=A0ABV3FT72_9NOCA
MGLPDSVTAVLFDLDGVLTSTAVLHRRAWKQIFDSYLADHAGPDERPFDERDYLEYVDGRPRQEGVRAFLVSRDITLPDGDPGDPADALTVYGLGNRKNQVLLAIIENEGVQAYPGSVAYVRAVRDQGLRVGVVTSSANAEAVLAATGLDRFVDVRVDGATIAARGLRGKPEPDSFLAAAEQLGVRPEHAAVFEDAISGVRAGRAGRFGYVVGVDRVRDSEHARALLEVGADIVIPDLSSLRATR